MNELIKEKILDGIEDKYLSEAMDYAKIHKVKKQRLIHVLGRMAACFAIIIGLSVSSLSIAVAAGNMAAYDVLYAIYPDIAIKLMPVNASCEDGGIRMEVEGVSIQDSCAYVYISMHDLEGKYIDESIDLFDKTVHLINDFKAYFIANNQPIYENPSPGNKAGGISTLEEKSLGCTQKCGGSAVKDVLMYGERIARNGLNLLSAPGNDLVASTALASAGCHVVLFTTGRGTPFGTFVPTVKVSTNSTLYNNKQGWIDFNAGTLLEGETMETLSQRFIDYVVAVASGKETHNERKGYREIAIFKTGVTL